MQLADGPGSEFAKLAATVEGVEQARMLRPSILVITTSIEAGPKPEQTVNQINQQSSEAHSVHILQLIKLIWQLENSDELRWLFITDNEFDLDAKGCRRKLLWQLFCRFEVSRDLYFDDNKKRIAWDATAPIPRKGGIPIRPWPAITLHDPKVVAKIDAMAKQEGWPWV